MAATEEGKIDIGKLQLKLFAGPNGINVLDLVPGKAPPLRPKSPLPQRNETILTVTETPRPVLPTIQLDIDLNEDDENKSDDERLDEDNVLSSLCKKRPKKPNVRPPSRTFVKRLGSSSSSEEVTVLIDTKANTPSLNVVDKNENGNEINLSTKVNHLAPLSNDDRLPPSSNSDELSVILPKNQINSFRPVKPKNDDTEKQLNITLITKALQERNAKKKEIDSTENIEPPKVNFLNVLDKSGDAQKETKGINSNSSLSPKNATGKKPPPTVSPKPLRKTFNISTNDNKPLKPSEIAKEQRNVRNTESVEQKKKANIISPKEGSTYATPTKEDSTKTISTKVDISQTKIDSLKDKNSIKSTLEQITKKNSEKTNNDTISVNGAEVDKPVTLEIKEDKISERYNKDISESTYNKEDPTLRLRSNTHSLKRPETSEITYNRTLSEGSKIPKTTPKLDRTQSEIPKLRKEPNKSSKSNEKDELSNKTYLELETLKNISQKANDKSQGSDKSVDSRKLPTQRTFGSIENISVKRYQRIETSDYFKYKKASDEPRAKENENILTTNEKNDTSDLFKSKVDGHKDGRIRERSNTTDVKSNIKYVPYSSGKITNSFDSFTPSTYNRSLSSNDASLLPRFKGSSGHTSSIVTKSNLVKPCPSFPSRVLDRFMPKTNSTIETKRSNTTYT